MNGARKTEQLTANEITAVLIAINNVLYGMSLIHCGGVDIPPNQLLLAENIRRYAEQLKQIRSKLMIHYQEVSGSERIEQLSAQSADGGFENA